MRLGVISLYILLELTGVCDLTPQLCTQPRATCSYTISKESLLDEGASQLFR